MKIIHSYLNEARSVTNSVSTAAKLCEDFEAVVWKLLGSGAMLQAGHLPTYEKETREFSLFHMSNQAYKACKAFRVTAQRAEELIKHYLAENS